MRVLVTGGSGLLGKKFVSILQEQHQVTGTCHDHSFNGLIPVDLQNDTDIADNFDRVRPELVIHTAAMTNVEQSEAEKLKALRVNTTSSALLAELCRRADSKFVFFSSDYVFSGNNSPYQEDDTANPLSFYGLTKLMAEKTVMAINPDSVIIRPCIMYGYNDELDKPTFPLQVLSSLRQDKPITVDNRRIKYPILIDDIVANTMMIVGEKLKGVFHFSIAEGLTRYEWARTIATVFSYPVELVRGESLEAGKPLDIRLLNTRKIDYYFRDCKAGAQLLEEQMNENN